MSAPGNPVSMFRRAVLRAGVLLCLAVQPALAEGTADSGEPGAFIEAGTRELSEYLWTARPLVVFADSPADPRYTEQMEMLRADLAGLGERDVVILTDTDPAARSPLRQALRPRGFVVVLIDKDGVIKLRKPSPWTVREISRSIDKTPLRQDEIRLRRGSGS